MIDGMLAIDAHCHIGELKAERQGFRRFTADDLVARMDRNGIDKAVVCHLISPLWERVEIQKGNDLVLEATCQHPDRLVGLCVVNPKHGRFAQQEARRCLEVGLKGLKVQPAMHGCYPVDGEVMDPLMEIAAAANVPLVTHSDFNAKCCTPYRVVRLAARYPQVTILMLHMGIDHEMLIHVPDIVGPLRNIVVDTSQTSDSPYAVFVNSARCIGADRVVFGSDMPAVSLETNLAKLKAAEDFGGLNEDEKRKILAENALRVFHIR